MPHTKPTCKKCGKTPTIRAHLIPLGFSHKVRGKNKNIAILMKSKTRMNLVQSATTDNEILCAVCDREIGALDDYALKFCNKFRTLTHSLRPYFLVKDVDTNMLVRFAASVIWRCAISTRIETSKINLGSEEAAFKDIVFSEPQALILYPKVALMRYVSNVLDDVEHFCSLPSPTEVTLAPTGSIFYSISLGGFRMVIKTDRGDWPQNLRPSPINGQANASGVFVNLDTSHEFRELVGLLKRSRRHQRLP